LTNKGEDVLCVKLVSDSIVMSFENIFKTTNKWKVITSDFHSLRINNKY
jgi:hypothetical protein